MTDRMEAAMSVEAPERIWIESEGGCPYFYHEEELSDVGSPVTEYVRADKLRSEIDALRAEVDALRKAIDRAWNEGFDFAMKACGWQEGEDPATEGLYVVRDSKGNVEVGMWYAKTVTQPAEWTREFRDVDRDDIVAWMAIPDWRAARDAYKLAARDAARVAGGTESKEK